MKTLVRFYIIKEIFPFSDIDDDVQEYAEHIYYYMNSQILQIKEWVDKFQPKIAEEIKNLTSDRLKKLFQSKSGI